MEFSDNIKNLADKIKELKEKIINEESTKTAFIMPFFEILGYDTRNPLEFLPEFSADTGKKGEKVDYAIMMNDKPIILIEAKPCNSVLEGKDPQLMRYFQSVSARIGILTNGIIYKFFTDLDEPNKMDILPFLEIDILKIRNNDSIINDIKNTFHKANFNIENVLFFAENTKYSNAIKTHLQKQIKFPDDNFVSYILSEIYTGIKTQKVKEKFKLLIEKSFNQLINDMVRETFDKAMNQEIEKNKTIPQEDPLSTKPDTSIETTELELQGFHIIRAILSEVVDPNRIYYKDTQRYINIVLDENILKWICRLYLNNPNNMHIDFKGNEGKEIRHDLKTLNDLYKLKNEILKAYNSIISSYKEETK